jgi:hypothetical protein
MNIEMAVLWVVGPRILVEVNWRFRDAFCLHQQGYHSSNGGKCLPEYMALQLRRQTSA